VQLSSLVVIEPPAVELLQEREELQHYEAFRRMTDAYFAAYEGGDAAAIEGMIDFYGGTGTFAGWRGNVRAYALDTTAVNILDWAGAYGFRLSAASLATIEIPTLVLWGGASHPAMRRINALLFEYMNRAAMATIDGAAHFMIATHAGEVGRLIAEHVHDVESSASPAHLGFCDRNKPEETMTVTQKIDPGTNPRPVSNSKRLFVCPITGHPCEGDLSHLCEDYGCARKGGLSPRSDENF
jgi:hypothetical protein